MTVVVLRALALGDLLVSVPALRGLRRGYPGERIVLATPAELAQLAMLSGAVDEVLPARGLRPLAWDRPAPDVAVNLHGRGPRSHAVLAALRPGRLIGFASPSWPGPAWDDDEHEADRWCRLTGGDPTGLRLPRPPSTPSAKCGNSAGPEPGGVTTLGGGAPDGGLTLIHPGAAYGCRRWPPDRYAAVARALLADGHRVAITGSPAERELALAVARDAPGSVALAGTTSVLELAGLVAWARLLICGDTGVAHLATAFGTPSVLLFGPVSPALWGPRTGGPHTVLWHPDRVRGDRWAADPDPALLAITPAEVLAGCFASRR